MKPSTTADRREIFWGKFLEKFSGHFVTHRDHRFWIEARADFPSEESIAFVRKVCDRLSKDFPFSRVVHVFLDYKHGAHIIRVGTIEQSELTGLDDLSDKILDDGQSMIKVEIHHVESLYRNHDGFFIMDYLHEKMKREFT